MDEIKINSKEELYTKLKPALNTKIEELRTKGIGYIKIGDLWEYLSQDVWTKSKDLTLSQCVDDILNASEIELKQYIKNKMSNILGSTR